MKNKLEELHKNIAQKEYYDSFDEGGHTNFLDTERIGKQSAEITADVSVKFGNWLKKEMVVKKGRYYFKGDFYNQQKKEPTTQKLFQIFINNHYESNT